MSAAGRVRIVDDDPDIRLALERLLALRGLACDGFESAESFLAAGGAADADCVIVDLHLPALDGLALQERLHAAGEVVPVVVITGRADVPTTVRALKAGAVDFLEKPLDGRTLATTVEAAVARGRAQRAVQRARDAVAARWATLTHREREVLRGVVEGRLNKQVAAALGIAEPTVKQYRGSAMRKLGVISVPEALQLLLALGVVDPALPPVPPGP